MNQPHPAPPSLSAEPLISNLQREHDFEPLRVEGLLPKDLSGVIYRNGPGLMERFGKRYDHLFEGDGAISAVRFSGGSASGAARVIQTAGLVEEDAAGRHLSGYAAPWLQRIYRMYRGESKNTANTNIISWQGRLLALMEGGLPTELSPERLETIGTTDLGVIPGTFSAHPHRIESRKALYNFGQSFGKQTTLDLFMLPDQGPAKLLGQIPLRSPVLLHDFIVTENHMVFFVSPSKIVIWRMMMALRPFQDSFTWAPDEGTEIIIVPIDKPDDVIRFITPAFYQWHFANAWEDKGEIIVDYVRYTDLSSLTQIGDRPTFSFKNPENISQGVPHRARIDIEGKTLTSAALGDIRCEFPQVSPLAQGHPHRYLWVESERYIDGSMRFSISKHDSRHSSEHEAWIHQHLARGEVCSEPMVIPRPGATQEDDGYIVTLVYSGETRRSFWLVLEASTLEVLARVHLEQAIPVTFHGSWVPTDQCQLKTTT